VENLWFYQDLEVDHTKEKLVPDASMELIIDLSEGPKPLYDRGNHKRFVNYNRCWVSGMQRQYLVIGTVAGSSMMGAHFRTGGAAPFFGFPLSELSGEVIELDLIWKREILSLRDQLLETTQIETKFDLLEAYLLQKAQSRVGPDRAMSAALATLRSWPLLRLKDLASQLGLSHRQMLASFDCRVGMTPKVVSRIFRFQSALRATCKSGENVDWSDLAVACGYYDQAHLIHEFQQMGGLTPAEYQKNRTIYPNYIPVVD
jgi:AraC-like DNA-binding protein